MFYTAKIYEEDDAYLVEFPDLLGTLTYGETLEEAKAMAKDAMDLTLMCYNDEGEPWPEAKTEPDEEHGFYAIEVSPEVEKNEIPEAEDASAKEPEFDENEHMEDKKDTNLWETDDLKKLKPMLHKMWKEREEERRKRGELDEPEPTALAKSSLPTREEIEELDRIGIAGIMKKRERQERWDAIWFWVMVSLSSVCGGVVGTVLYRLIFG